MKTEDLYNIATATHNTAFSDSPLSLNNLHLILRYISIFFLCLSFLCFPFLFTEWFSTIWIFESWYTCATERHFGCFQGLVITNKAAINDFAFLKSKLGKFEMKLGKHLGIKLLDNMENYVCIYKKLLGFCFSQVLSIILHPGKCYIVNNLNLLRY